MKNWEKIAVGAGIIAILYFVMKDKDKDKDGEYKYQRQKKGQSSWEAYEKKKGSRSGS